MYEVGPVRAPQPQSAAASLAEAALGVTFAQRVHSTVSDSRPVHFNMFFAFHVQRIEVSAQVDGVSAAAIGFTADGAIAKIKWVGMLR